MKRFRLFLGFALALSPAVLAGCVSFDSSESSSWAAGKSEDLKGVVRIISVSVDKSGEYGGLENEVRDLLPLLFLEQGYMTVSSGGKMALSSGNFPDSGGLPFYSANVKIREREYQDGWKTSRSLSAELRLWAADNGTNEIAPDAQPLPLSAGRALNNGKKSFSSSGTLSAMLRKAIKNAVGALPQKGRNAGRESR